MNKDQKTTLLGIVRDVALVLLFLSILFGLSAIGTILQQNEYRNNSIEVNATVLQKYKTSGGGKIIDNNDTSHRRPFSIDYCISVQYKVSSEISDNNLINTDLCEDQLMNFNLWENIDIGNEIKIIYLKSDNKKAILTDSFKLENLALYKRWDFALYSFIIGSAASGICTFFIKKYKFEF